MKLVVFSYNIHKGMNLARRSTLQAMREEIRKINPDIIFLQEIYGHNGKEETSAPNVSQFEYLAETLWPHFSYGKNVALDKAHYGNAILSKFPIVNFENMPISTNPLEKRGLLHAQLQVTSQKNLHVFCTHLNLSAHGRKKQIKMMIQNINRIVPATEPLLLAGDFNDWQHSAHAILKNPLNLSEAFLSHQGKCAKTFPAFLPFLCLDRIYFRSLQVLDGKTLSHSPWPSLSDHLPLKAEFEYL